MVSLILHRIFFPRSLAVLVFLFFLPFQDIGAEFILQPIVGTNRGEFIFETGNRHPNLSGTVGGSRISFDRNYNYGGFGGKWVQDRFEISARFTTTGWFVRSGRARDEDFFLYSISQERAHHFDTRTFSYQDSVTVYSGTRNFADGIGKSSLSEYNTQVMGRYYFGSARADYQNSGDGFFLSTGFRYTYNKYHFYDVNQWVATIPVFYQPIGYGLSFSSALLEWPVGIGYRWNWEKFYLDTNFHLLMCYTKSRDFHYQRNINFHSESGGLGILATGELGYKISPGLAAILRMNQYRYFTKGSFYAQGGLSREDIIANFIGRVKSHANAKEFNLELGVDFRPF